MSRVKWVVMVALVLGSSPVWASSPFETQIVPAVLHLPGEDSRIRISFRNSVRYPAPVPENVEF